MKTLTARIFTTLGFALITTAMVFTFAACQPEPDSDKDNDNHQIPAELQGTWTDADGDELSFTEYDVTVRLGGQSKTYQLKSSKTEGNKTTLYFSNNKEQDYIVYQNENGVIVIIEVNLGGVPKTGLWEGPILGQGFYGDFEYSYGTTTVTIIRYHGSGGDVTIPAEIDGKPVTAIKMKNKSIGGVFYNNRELTSVIIPDSITYIGDETFMYCFQLTSVTIGNSVTYIGSSAFQQNTNLTSVTIPDSVTYIGDKAFYYCTELATVTIGSSVTHIGDGAFAWNKLSSVTIPNSVTYIGDDAFRSQGETPNRLTSVTIGNSVTHIGDGAFSGNQLTSITIPNSVTHIGDGAFSGNQLTSVTIPNSVTSIGDSAFQNSKLTSVTIGNSVTSIGDNAFQHNQLTSVTIPNSVTSIGYWAFIWNQLTSVTIGNSVTSIGNEAFSGAIYGDWDYSNKLTSVTIGANVTLGSGAFDGDSSISSGFETTYNNGGKQAGTYTRTSTSVTVWTKQ